MTGFSPSARGQGTDGKAAELFDPLGNPAAAVRKSVDQEDKGRYELVLSAAIEPGKGERTRFVAVSKAAAIKIEGFSPYWASAPDKLFNLPGRPDRWHYPH